MVKQTEKAKVKNKTNYKMHNEIHREKVMLMSLKPWNLNPRGSNLRGIEEFAEVLKLEGIREDMHVFNRNGERTIMQGHRRHAAAQLANIGEVWVKDYGALDDAEAMEVLVSLQNGTDPFDALELATAARTLVKLGRTSEEVAKVFHRSPDTVQLYLDLETLPHTVQEAIWKGKLSLELADLMRNIISKEKQEEALDLVLKDKLTGQPMSTAQARVFLQEAYLKPQRWEKQWAELVGKLRKKLTAKFTSVTFVDWHDRDQYVMSEAMPITGLMRVDEYIDSDLLVNAAEPMTWGAIANLYGVPVFIAPAMVIESKHLVMVWQKSIRDADSTSEKPILKTKNKVNKTKVALDQDLKTTDNFKSFISDNGLDSKNKVNEVVVAQENKQSTQLSEIEIDRFERILAALMRTPDIVRTDDLWKPLLPIIWETIWPLLGDKEKANLRVIIERDENNRRRGMRHVFASSIVAIMAINNGDGIFENALREIENALEIEHS